MTVRPLPYLTARRSLCALAAAVGAVNFLPATADARMGSIMVATTAALRSADEPISGVGSGFATPVMEAWAELNRLHTGTVIHFHPYSPAQAIAMVADGKADFATLDLPLPPTLLDHKGLQQVPLLAGGIVPAINLPGVPDKSLHLTGELLAAIYLGKITAWNDPAIRALNPGVELPELAITPIHLTAPSSTTFLFSDYLTAKSQEWRDRVGANLTVAWPTGKGVADGATAAHTVVKTPGAIAYVDDLFVAGGGLQVAALQNLDGNFVTPGPESFKAAAAHTDWLHAPALGTVPLDRPGAQSWPIAETSYLVIQRHPTNPTRTHEVLSFEYRLSAEGREAAGWYGQSPMPDTVVSLLAPKGESPSTAPEFEVGLAVPAGN